MNKNLISLGILLALLPSCSGKPVGFQGDTASMAGSTVSGEATGRSMGNRDAASDDAIASSGNPGESIDVQSIEAENVEMDAVNIFEGSDATVSIPADVTIASNASATGASTSSATSTSNGAGTSGSNAAGISNSNAAGTSGSNAAGASNSNAAGASNSNAAGASGSNATGASTAIAASATNPWTLTIQVPSTSLRSGSAPMQVMAKLAGLTTSADVTWTIQAPKGKSSGTIDSNGLYTAPASGGGYDITLTATLNDDPSITASQQIKIVVPDQIFVGCQQGSEFFSITADVYQLPAQTAKLPNFSSLGPRLTTVCMDQYNIAPRDWSTGFPGLTGLFEWFGLHTTTHLLAASDGTYTFKLNADDGAKLYIDGRLIIDNDGQHAPTAKEASVSLTAGDHALSIDYFQGPRYQIALELYWKIPGSSTYVYVPKASFK